MEEMSKKNRIVIPFGWKRHVEQKIATSMRHVTYISPSGTVLSSIAEVCQYLENNTTCKCGLQCPLHVPKVFSFNPEVISVNMTKKEWIEMKEPPACQKTCVHWKEIRKKYLSKRKKPSSGKATKEPPPKLIIIRKGGRLTSVIPCKKNTAASGLEVIKKGKGLKNSKKTVKTQPMVACSDVQGTAVSKDFTKMSDVSPLKSPLFESVTTPKADASENTSKSKSEFKLQWIKGDDESVHHDAESGNELCFSPDFKKSPPMAFPRSLLTSAISPPAHHGMHMPMKSNLCSPLFSPTYSNSMSAMSTGIEPVHRFGMSAFPGSNFMLKNTHGQDASFPGHATNCPPQQLPGQPPRYSQITMKPERDAQTNQASPYPIPVVPSKFFHAGSNVGHPIGIKEGHLNMHWQQSSVQGMPTGMNKNSSCLMRKGSGPSYSHSNQMPPSPFGPCSRSQIPSMHEVNPMRSGTPQQFPMGSPPPCNPTSPYNYPSIGQGQGLVGASPSHRTNSSPFSNRSHSRSSSMGTPTPSPLPGIQRQGCRAGFGGDIPRPQSCSGNGATPRPIASPSSLQQWNPMNQNVGSYQRIPGNLRNFSTGACQGSVSPFSPPRQVYQPFGFPKPTQNDMGSPFALSQHSQYSNDAIQQNQRFPNQQHFNSPDPVNMQLPSNQFTPDEHYNACMHAQANAAGNKMQPRLPVTQKIETNIRPVNTLNVLRHCPPYHTHMKNSESRYRMAHDFSLSSFEQGMRPVRHHMQGVPYHNVAMQAQWRSMNHNVLSPHLRMPGQFHPSGVMFGGNRLIRPTAPAQVASLATCHALARNSAVTTAAPKPKRTRKRKTSKAVKSATQQNLPTTTTSSSQGNLPVTQNFMTANFPEFFGPQKCVQKDAESSERPNSSEQDPQQYILDACGAIPPKPGLPDDVSDNVNSTAQSLIMLPELELPQTPPQKQNIEEPTKGTNRVMSPIAPTLFSPEPDASLDASGGEEESRECAVEVKKSCEKAPERAVTTPPLPLLSPSLLFEAEEDDFSDFASPAPTAFGFYDSSFTTKVKLDPTLTSDALKPDTKLVEFVSGPLVTKSDGQRVLTTSQVCSSVKLSMITEPRVSPALTKCALATSVSETHLPKTLPVSAGISMRSTSALINQKLDTSLTPFRHPQFLHSNAPSASTRLVSSSGKVFQVPEQFGKKSRNARHFSGNVKPSFRAHSEKRRRYLSDPYPEISHSIRGEMDQRYTSFEFPCLPHWRQKFNLHKERLSYESTIRSTGVVKACHSKGYFAANTVICSTSKDVQTTSLPTSVHGPPGYSYASKVSTAVNPAMHVEGGITTAKAQISELVAEEVPSSVSAFNQESKSHKVVASTPEPPSSPLCQLVPVVSSSVALSAGNEPNNASITAFTDTLNLKDENSKQSVEQHKVNTVVKRQYSEIFSMESNISVAVTSSILPVTKSASTRAKVVCAGLKESTASEDNEINEENEQTEHKKGLEKFDGVDEANEETNIQASVSEETNVSPSNLAVELTKAYLMFTSSQPVLCQTGAAVNASLTDNNVSYLSKSKICYTIAESTHLNSSSPNANTHSKIEPLKQQGQVITSLSTGQQMLTDPDTTEPQKNSDSSSPTQQCGQQMLTDPDTTEPQKNSDSSSPTQHDSVESDETNTPGKDQSTEDNPTSDSTPEVSDHMNVEDCGLVSNNDISDVITDGTTTVDSASRSSTLLCCQVDNGVAGESDVLTWSSADEETKNFGSLRQEDSLEPEMGKKTHRTEDATMKDSRLPNEENLNLAQTQCSAETSGIVSRSLDVASGDDMQVKEDSIVEDRGVASVVATALMPVMTTKTSPRRVISESLSNHLPEPSVDDKMETSNGVSDYMVPVELHDVKTSAVDILPTPEQVSSSAVPTKSLHLSGDTLGLNEGLTDSESLQTTEPKELEVSELSEKKKPETTVVKCVEDTRQHTDKNDEVGHEEDDRMMTSAGLATVKIDTDSEMPEVCMSAPQLPVETENQERKEKFLTSSAEIFKPPDTCPKTPAVSGTQVPSTDTSIAGLGFSQDLTDTVIRQLSSFNTILKNLLVSGVQISPSVLAQLNCNTGQLNEQQEKTLSAILTNSVKRHVVSAAPLSSSAMLLFQEPILHGILGSAKASAGQMLGSDPNGKDEEPGTSSQELKHPKQHHSDSDESAAYFSDDKHAKARQLRDYAGPPPHSSTDMPSMAVIDLKAKESDADTGNKLEDSLNVPASSMLITADTATTSGGVDSPQVPSTSEKLDQDATGCQTNTRPSTPPFKMDPASTNQGLQVPIVSSSVKGTQPGDADDDQSDLYMSNTNEILRTGSNLPKIQDEVSTSQLSQVSPLLEEEKEAKSIKNVPTVGSSTGMYCVERRRGRSRNSAVKQNMKRPTAAVPTEKPPKRSSAIASAAVLSNLRCTHRTLASSEKQIRAVKSGDLVWGQMRGFPSWPGKVVKASEVRGIQQRTPLPDGKVWVKWFGDHTFAQMNPAELRTMTEGLEAHHRSRKKGRTRNRKISIHLETAIQEAVDELEHQDMKQTGSKKMLSSLATAASSSVSQPLADTAEPVKQRGRGRKRKAL